MLTIKSNGLTTSVFYFDTEIAGLQFIQVEMHEKELTKCLLDFIPYKPEYIRHDEKSKSLSNDTKNLIIDVNHLICFSKIIYKEQNLIDKFSAEGKTINQIFFKAEVNNVFCSLVYSTMKTIETEDGCTTEVVSHKIDDLFVL